MRTFSFTWTPRKAAIFAVAVLVTGACGGTAPQGTPLPPVATAAAPVKVPTPVDTPAVPATQAPNPTATALPGPSPGPTQTPAASPEGPTVVIEEVRFGAEIANTLALRTTGLSNRPDLPAQTGMLFIFESGVASNFWMKEMQFPLDFVWIGADCTVVDITENVPHPESPASQLPLYASGRTAAFNFEINGGEANALGLAIGDGVRFNGIDVQGAHC